MNDHIIKLQGKASIPEPLTIGHNFRIEAEGSITEEKKSDKEDGDFIITYKFEPVMIEVVTDKGEKIRAKDTRRRSQQLRSSLFRQWQNNNDGTDFDEWYDRKMLHFINEVLED